MPICRSVSYMWHNKYFDPQDLHCCDCTSGFFCEALDHRNLLLSTKVILICMFGDGNYCFETYPETGLVLPSVTIARSSSPFLVPFWIWLWTLTSTFSDSSVCFASPWPTSLPGCAIEFCWLFEACWTESIGGLSSFTAGLEEEQPIPKSAGFFRQLQSCRICLLLNCNPSKVPNTNSNLCPGSLD